MKAKAMTATATKERPILFSAPMVRALLEGRKTQTRRIVKGGELVIAHPAVVGWKMEGGVAHPFAKSKDVERQYVSTFPCAVKCPYGRVGGRLWVKETHALLYRKSQCPVVAYRADDSARIIFDGGQGPFTIADDAGAAASTWRGEALRWRPSIHMHRWASRITLKVLNIRVEQVQDISEQDAVAEGMLDREAAKKAGGGHFLTPRARFLDLFYNINKRAPRASNPWVWVIDFQVVKG